MADNLVEAIAQGYSNKRMAILADPGTGLPLGVAKTTKKATAAANTNATSVKTSPGVIKGGYLRNRAAAEKYVKFYDKATAPTVGTDVPIITIGIPAGGSVPLAAVVGDGLWFAVGIAYAITGAFADNDTTAVAAADVDVNLIYS